MPLNFNKAEFVRSAGEPICRMSTIRTPLVMAAASPRRPAPLSPGCPDPRRNNSSTSYNRLPPLLLCARQEPKETPNGIGEKIVRRIGKIFGI